jgi:ataxin-3
LFKNKVKTSVKKNEIAKNIMEFIFHEKQEGSLCAQHCLNSLLQDDYYSAVDLASLARELDAIELGFLISNTGTRDLAARIPESSNYDDTGFFSIQVLQKALKSFRLDLIPYTSSQEIAQMARDSPTEQKAYICNFRAHWYTIRKIGNYWFNLNSLLPRPELISDMHLSIMLAQLINDGYSIFIVDGELPKSEADLRMRDCVLNVKDILTVQSERKKNRRSDEDPDGHFDDELKLALRMSLIENDMDLDDRHGDPYPSLAYENMPQYQGAAAGSSQRQQTDEDDLRRAIELSMQQESKQTQRPAMAATSLGPLPTVKAVDPEEVRKKRLEFLEKMQSQQQQQNKEN